jgi:hypothetical protein
MNALLLDHDRCSPRVVIIHVMIGQRDSRFVIGGLRMNICNSLRLCKPHRDFAYGHELPSRTNLDLLSVGRLLSHAQGILSYCA